MLSEIQVMLLVRGPDLPLDEVTDFIGLTPTSTSSPGEIIPRTGARAKCSTWWFELPTERASCVWEVLVRLLDKLEPHSERILAASSRFCAECSVDCVVHMTDDPPNCFLPKDVLQRIVAMGADFDLDLYQCELEDEPAEGDNSSDSGKQNGTGSSI